MQQGTSSTSTVSGNDSNNDSGLWTSWNGRIHHPVRHMLHPSNREELQQMVADSESLRVTGTGKSSSDICGGTTDLLSMDRMNQILCTGEARDASGRTFSWVQAEAGVLLADLIQFLESRGLGFAALPDIDNITLGGALSTGTHGTGNPGPSLSDLMVGCSVIAADGRLVHSGFLPPVSPLAGTALPAGPELDALRVSLGLLGILYAPVLEVRTIEILALEESPCPNETWESSWPGWQKEDSFTRVLFLPHTGKGWVIRGRKPMPGSDFTPLPPPAHAANRRKTSMFLYRLLAKHPWLTALANRFLAWRYFTSPVRKSGTLYRTTVTSSRSGSGTMVLAEWSIPFSRFAPCFRDLRNAIEAPGHPAGAHIPMDVRFWKGSTAWLSNATEGDSVSVGCVCRVPEKADAYRAFADMERIFLRHGGRPHWGKHFMADRDTLRALYPRWDDFIAVRRSWDPRGKFLNQWLGKYFS